jgi:hypothetical protein
MGRPSRDLQRVAIAKQKQNLVEPRTARFRAACVVNEDVLPGDASRDADLLGNERHRCDGQLAAIAGKPSLELEELQEQREPEPRPRPPCCPPASSRPQ